MNPDSEKKKLLDSFQEWTGVDLAKIQAIAKTILGRESVWRGWTGENWDVDIKNIFQTYVLNTNISRPTSTCIG